MVAAEDVALTVHGHRLPRIVVDLVAVLGDRQRHAQRGVGEDEVNGNTRSKSAPAAVATTHGERADRK
jgi:hypothetical protein